jgi:glycosyltransferase involved in cell wall biosynthesis
VGNFTPAKRHDRLISAYHKAKISTPLLLVGAESNLMFQAKEQVKKLGLEDRVIFTGFVTNPYPLILNAKGLILSSDFEGMPMILIEASCLDTPIVSTACNSGPSEIVGEMKHCLSLLTVEDLSSKISKLDANPEQFKIPFNQKFSLENMVNQYFELI